MLTLYKLDTHYGIKMHRFWLLIFLVYSNVAHAEDALSKPCINAIHQHYLFLTLVKPNFKTIPKDRLDFANDKVKLLENSLLQECPESVTQEILKLTENFSIKKSRFLRDFKHDIKVDMPLVGEEIPLDKANMADDAIKLWATMTLLKSYDITAGSFTSFDHLKPYYTAKSLQAVVDDLIMGYLRGHARILPSNKILIKDKNFSVRGYMASIPEILSQGIGELGRYTWRLKVPMLVESTKKDRIKKEKVTAYIELIRMPLENAEDGVLVSEYEVRYE